MELIIKKRKENKRITFFLLIAFQALVLIVILLFCSVKYEVSDDFIMESFLSGIYSGYDPRLLFANVLLGYILYPFYLILPSVSWYFWFQILCIFCSFAAIAFILSYNLPRYAAFLSFAVLMGFLTKDLFLLVQFTKTAAFTIAAGTFLFLWALTKELSAKVATLGAVLAIAGAFIRFSSLYIVAVFAAVYLIYIAVERLSFSKKKGTFKKVLLRIYLPGVLLLVFLFCLNYFSGFINNLNSQYRNYRSFSSVRSKIIDYPKPAYSDYEEEFQEIGVSENDFEMIRTWNFTDSEFFTTEKMNEVLAVISDYRDGNTASLREIKNTIRDREVLYYPGVICCFLLALLCIFFSPKYLWVVPAAAVVAFGWMIYLIINGRCVYRVESSLLLVAALLISVVLTDRRKIDYRRHQKRETIISFVAPCIAFIVLCISFFACVPDNVSNIRGTDSYRDYIDDTFYHSADYDPAKYNKNIEPGHIRPDFLKLAEEHPENIYLLDFNTTIQTLYYDFSPYESAASVFPSNLVFLGGVTVNHPAISGLLEKNGVNTPMELLLKENVYLISNYNDELFSIYLQEHALSSGKKTYVDTVGGYMIWDYE